MKLMKLMKLIDSSPFSSLFSSPTTSTTAVMLVDEWTRVDR